MLTKPFEKIKPRNFNCNLLPNPNNNINIYTKYG